MALTKKDLLQELKRYKDFEFENFHSLELSDEFISRDVDIVSEQKVQDLIDELEKTNYEGIMYIQYETFAFEPIAYVTLCSDGYIEIS